MHCRSIILLLVCNFVAGALFACIVSLQCVRCLICFVVVNLRQNNSKKPLQVSDLLKFLDHGKFKGTETNCMWQTVPGRLFQICCNEICLQTKLLDKYIFQTFSCFYFAILSHQFYFNYYCPFSEDRTVTSCMSFNLFTIGITYSNQFSGSQV